MNQATGGEQATRLERVTDLMSTDLETVDRGATLAVADERMLAAGAGSAIVVEDGVPVGILTGADALRAALESGASLADVWVEGAKSAPLVAVEPGASVTHALRTMAEHGVERLPVIDGLERRGIVTTSDVARALPDRLAEVRRIEVERER